MPEHDNELHDSTDRPPASLALFGVGAAGVILAIAGVIITFIPLCLLGGLLVVGSAGLFWLGASLNG